MKYRGNKIKIDSRRFNNIFETNFPSLCFFAQKLLPETDQVKDIVQEAFIKLWGCNIDFENDKSVKAYLYVLVRNSCYDHYKKKQNIESIDQFDEDVISEENFLAEIVREETYCLLDNAINDLADQTKKVVILTLNGNTNSDIATELDISINTVKTLKLRAYKNLRHQLGKQFVAILFTELINFF